jgi:uncharacterized oligopeptide transporter (OPT) family protein
MAQPSSRPYREITISSIIFGVVVGAIMNAAITYAGLKIGFTIVGSAIAAVLGFGVLRGVLRRGSILETNIGQTIASAVNTTNAGIIFTVPVLMLMANRSLRFDDPNFWYITLACMAGALLGCVFIVPLRKQMLDVERLRFPSATAVAAILKSPGAGAAKSIVLVIGAFIGVLVYLPAALPAIKSPAQLSQLDSLVARERIAPQTAALTREIDDWIQAAAAPAILAERGRFVDQMRPLQAEMAVLDPDDDKARLEELKRQIAAIEGQVKELGEEPAKYPAALALGVYEATEGRRTWDSLRDGRFGWAMSPLLGYQDIGLRLPTRQSGPPSDRDGDGRNDLFVTDDRVHVGRLIGLPDQIELIFAIAPFAIGAGYLTGRAGLVVLAGVLLAYLVLNPIAYQFGWLPELKHAHETGRTALKVFNQPLGIGLLLGGALMGIIAALPAMKEAMKSLRRASRGGAPRSSTGSSDEMGLRSLLIVAGIAMIMLLIALEFVGKGGAATAGGLLQDWPVWAVRVVIALIGAAWIWFAGIIIAQCTGMTDWSPISGMALLTVVLVMFLAGSKDVISAVTLGAALCVAIACASDMMGDLKTGYLVGSIPRRQQIMEIACAGIGPLITMSTLVLIASVNLSQTGIAIGPGTPTVAPQAQALEVVIKGVQGEEMPYALYGLGGIIGILLGLAAFPGLGVLVGLSMYLPVFYILTYGLGCLANMIVAKIKGRTWAEEWGVPFCAGLIVGEATLSLVINSIVLIRG